MLLPRPVEDHPGLDLALHHGQAERRSPKRGREVPAVGLHRRMNQNRPIPGVHHFRWAWRHHRRRFCGLARAPWPRQLFRKLRGETAIRIPREDSSRPQSCFDANGASPRTPRHRKRPTGPRRKSCRCPIPPRKQLRAASANGMCSEWWTPIKITDRVAL